MTERDNRSTGAPGPARADSRIVLGAGFSVQEADPAVYETFDLPEAEGTPEALRKRMETLGVFPHADWPNALFRRTAYKGSWEGVLELAYARDAAGGWTIVVRALRDEDVRARGFQSLASFLSISAHELRTPITSLKAALQILRKRLAGDNSEGLDMIDVALRNTARLQGLVDDIVDNMKLSAGQVELRLGSVEPGQLLEEARTAAAEATGRDDITIVGDGSEAPAVFGDRARLEQVLVELIENAALCSDEGSGIELSARAEGGQVVFAVRDHGRGIPRDHQESVFQPFFQVDDSTTRHVPGLGLGLTICRGIVELHRGKIWVEGEEGSGSTVSFSLPLRESEA